MTRGATVFESNYELGFSSDGCGQLNGGANPTPPLLWGNDMSGYGSQSCAQQLYVWNAIIRAYYFYTAQAPTYVTVLDDAPGATSFYAAGEGHRLHVYAVGRDGTLYQNVWVPSGQYWGGWFPFAGSSCTSAPSAAGAWSNHLWVFCRGQNGAIYGNRWDGSAWLGWLSLGSTVQSGPGATNYCLPSGQCQLAVYALGWDGNIYENFCRLSEGCIWQGWNMLPNGGSPPGGCTAAPAASWRNAYERYVFCRGANAAIWYKKWNGSAWEPWQSRGGELDSGPGATDYYLSGEGWRVYHLSNIELGNIYVEWKASGWSGWQWFGGVCQSSPGASDVLNRVYLFFLCRGPDDSVWYSRWSGSAWDPSQSIGRPP